MVLGYFGRMHFYSAVQAELKAQVGDQSFVNRVCQTDAATSQILEKIYPNRAHIPGPKKIRSFIVVGEVLAERLVLKDVGGGDLHVCSELLRDRYQKVLGNPYILATIPVEAARWNEAICAFEGAPST